MTDFIRVIGTLLLLGGLAFGQTAPSTDPTFKLDINLVHVLATVRTPEGALVSNLGPEDFQLFDDDVSQRIAHFERTTAVPLSVAVMIDTSGSTMRDLHFEEESVGRFISALVNSGNENDRFALFSFNWRTNLEVDFSRDASRAHHAMHNLQGSGGTSLYDSIFLAADSLGDRQGRHVMVIVTDGGDTTSYKRYNDALAAAQRADVILYPIVIVPIASDAGRNTGGEHALATLANSTGGRIFYPENTARLNAAFDDIIRELRTQYFIGFYPTNTYGERHRFHSLRLTTGGHKLTISARNGYYEP